MQKPNSLCSIRMIILSTMIALVALLIMTMSASAHSATSQTPAIPAAGAPILHIVQTAKMHAIDNALPPYYN